MNQILILKDMKKTLIEGIDLQEVPLVQIHEGKAVTTSLQLAILLQRQHFALLRNIRSLNYSKAFLEENFIEAIYDTIANSTTNKSPMYYITKDGFLLLTSTLSVKLEPSLNDDYMEAFNEAEEKIKASQPLPELNQSKNILNENAMRTRMTSTQEREIFNISPLPSNIDEENMPQCQKKPITVDTELQLVLELLTHAKKQFNQIYAQMSTKGVPLCNSAQKDFTTYIDGAITNTIYLVGNQIEFDVKSGNI